MTDALCQDYHYERIYAIKLPGGKLPPPSGHSEPGPDPKYAVIESVVRRIRLAAEQLCAKVWRRRWNCGCRFTNATIHGFIRDGDIRFV